MIGKMIAGMLPYMPKKLVWIFSKKYIAGETMESALQETKKLNDLGILSTVDVLGEFITDLKQATVNKKEYVALIHRFCAAKLEGNFSIKPTMFGLLLDEQICYENIREIVKVAASYHSFVRIDMEDSKCVDKEIVLYRKLKKEFPSSVGLVLQAYLRRTSEDLEAMLNMHSEHSKCNFRLCKGIYIEPEEIAFKGYQEVRDRYVENLNTMLTKGIYVGIATHDQYLVEKAFQLIKKHKISKNMYEFQMLHGVTPELRNKIVKKGHKMRVYLPYGKDWFGYSTRRLKENPNMVWHILKAIFVKG